jgi:lambda family phage minor tail protein L
MSEEVPAKVITELQKLEPDALVELFLLDCSIFGGAVYPFHNQRAQGAGSVLFGGVTFQPIAMKAKGFAHNGTEQPPTPTITISAIGGVVAALVEQYDGLVGARVTRIRTFRKWLDDGSEPDSTARVSNDVYFVSRPVSSNRESFTFELESVLAMHGATIPFRKVMGRCQAQRFKDGVDCPYVGADSSCGKKVTDCAAKFGAGAALPFMGFPAVERITLTL